MKQPIKIQIEVHKVVEQRIRKHYYKTLGTCVINSSMSTPSYTHIHTHTHTQS